MDNDVLRQWLIDCKVDGWVTNDCLANLGFLDIENKQYKVRINLNQQLIDWLIDWLIDRSFVKANNRPIDMMKNAIHDDMHREQTCDQRGMDVK